MKKEIQQERPEARLDQLFWTFFKIGAFTFGGGWAMVPLIQKELVQKRRWMDDDEFVDLLAIAQSAPGPIAINTSVITGYKIKGVGGAAFSALGSTLPSFIVILAVAAFLADGPHVVQNFLRGTRPAIFGLLMSAVFKIGKTSVKTRKDLIFAVAAALLLIALGLNPVFVVLFAGLTGYLLGLFGERLKAEKVGGKRD